MNNKIIQSLIVSSLLSSSLMADFYIGLDYGQVSNTDKASASGISKTQSNKYSDIGIKFGVGTDGGWKYQLKISKIKYDKPIFDNSHKDLTEINMDFIKEFTVGKNFYPYLKFGFGYGWMNVDGYTDSSINEYNLNGGLGLSYKAIEHLYFNGGVDYVYRKWQDIKYGTTTISTTGSGTKLYLGVSYAF